MELTVITKKVEYIVLSTELLVQFYFRSQNEKYSKKINVSVAVWNTGPINAALAKPCLQSSGPETAVHIVFRKLL